MSKIGFIGLGIMGRPMAGHLLDAGHELVSVKRGKLDATLAEKVSFHDLTPHPWAGLPVTVRLVVQDVDYYQPRIPQSA